MKVLIDHNISHHIAHALAAMAKPHAHTVEAKKDKFHPATPDVEWLGVLGQEGGWALISNDHRIWKNPQEQAAMLHARVIGFFLEPGWRKRNVTEFERAARLILWWPRPMQQCEIVAPPAAFRVPIRPRSQLRSIPLPRR